MDYAGGLHEWVFRHMWAHPKQCFSGVGRLGPKRRGLCGAHSRDSGAEDGGGGL